MIPDIPFSAALRGIGPAADKFAQKVVNIQRKVIRERFVVSVFVLITKKLQTQIFVILKVAVEYIAKLW